MIENINMMKCPFCPNEFSISPPRIDGVTIPRYQITVCRSCYNMNWDGWELGREKLLIEHLKLNNIPIPHPNMNGRLPRD
ncbi:hypothetical protein ER57_11565 [Smithella sp. SCADC]|jgi:hypothetical protein|nr:hypothetical protein ER57_11565 [Smithella sp. SCADC]